MQEFFHTWYSQHLGRDFEMLVFGHSGMPVILFPTALGRYYQTKDFGLIDSVTDFINSGKIKIYCPDTLDRESWFNYGIEPSERIQRHNIYEKLILKDVIGFAKYETEFDKVALAGCDLGAYHAANIAFRFPEEISFLFTMGGTFNIKRFVYGYYSEDCYFNNPPDYLPNLSDESYLGKIKNIGIYIGSGDCDISLEENHNLSRVLSEKECTHKLDVVQGADHNWPWWQHMFYNFIKDLEY